MQTERTWKHLGGAWRGPSAASPSRTVVCSHRQVPPRVIYGLSQGGPLMTQKCRQTEKNGENKTARHAGARTANSELAGRARGGFLTRIEILRLRFRSCSITVPIYSCRPYQRFSLGTLRLFIIYCLVSICLSLCQCLSRSHGSTHGRSRDAPPRAVQAPMHHLARSHSSCNARGSTDQSR